MWPNQKISYFLINKNKSLLVIFILSLFLFIPMSYHNVYQINNNIVYAEEITIPILTYHNFTKDEGSSYQINIVEFEKQMDYLAVHNYSVISLSELLTGLRDGQLPPKPIVITIDDGFKSTYTLAYPILKKYNFPATLLIYTDFIEKNSSSLTWEEIREMTKNNIEIGSHTLSHCNLLRYKENESYDSYISRIKKEIFLSKEILESKIGSKVKFFAYPYGIYSPIIKNLIIQAGYEGILNANSMNNNLNADLFSLNRQIIFGQSPLNSFIQILNQRLFNISQIFPYDGEIESNQLVKIGAILEGDNYDAKTFSMKLGGAKVKFDFNAENREISFTPDSLKPLIKKSYIVNITALDKNSQHQRKTSWVITIK
ncbi:polysaccharide deacetylase family protein [bacterium]|nr:polysaccharide deacetylase family protein [bacterium]MBU4362491.1 polysaccharide deacetylase family protein [bacterium]MCG2761844.1 polysaccharide deacetylase family protein [Candidatus Atribacteria bacterium]